MKGYEFQFMTSVNSLERESTIQKTFNEVLLIGWNHPSAASVKFETRCQKIMDFSQKDLSKAKHTPS